MYYLVKEYSSMLVFIALLMLPSVFASGEKCTDPNLGTFSWRCASDEQHLKNNPLSIDISTHEIQRIIIGMAGTAVNDEEKEERMEIANKACLKELGDEKYAEDPLLTQNFSVMQFEQWMYKSIIYPKNAEISQHSMYVFQQLQKLCQIPLFAKLLPMHICPLSVVNICAQKYCEKLKAENSIGVDCKPFELTSNRENALADISDYQKFVSLCLIDDIYVCEKGPVFKRFLTYRNNAIISVINNEHKMQYEMSADRRTSEYNFEQTMVLQNMALDGNKDYVLNFTLTGVFDSDYFGIIDTPAMSDHINYWMELIEEKFRTVGFFFSSDFKLWINVNGENSVSYKSYGKPLSSGEKLALHYRSADDCMYLVRPSMNLDKIILCDWSKEANTDSEFHLMFANVVYPGNNITIELLP